MRMVRVGLATALLVVLASCANYGLAPAQSFDQRLAYANGAITSVVNTAATAKASGQISDADARHVRDIAKNAAEAADVARTLGDTPQGNTQLTLTLGILTELQKFLAASKKP